MENHWTFSTVCNGEITITTELTAEQMTFINHLALAINAVNQYCLREFDSPANIKDLTNVGICFSTFGENEEHEIQVTANLLENKLLFYCDGKLTKEENHTYKDFIYTFRMCDFDTLYSDAVDYAHLIED